MKRLPDIVHDGFSHQTQVAHSYTVWEPAECPRHPRRPQSRTAMTRNEEMQGVPVADESVPQAEQLDHVEELVDGVARQVGVDRVG